jgi:hypothetical protein
VHNKVLSLAGGIEELIESIGFTRVLLGNVNLKPNFIFKQGADTDGLKYAILKFKSFLKDGNSSEQGSKRAMPGVQEETK